ncbi:MAG: murein biosynthesis integral membrane protein MurJ [Deltaproteobacteria bacterium]|nr:murein biosynthesis integral membrane protein MurJ [Deltaproteobacteria bacterium]
MSDVPIPAPIPEPPVAPPTTTPASAAAANARENRSVTRNASILMVLTMVSRVAGLVRDTMITHFFGASGMTDVFYMAFTIPNVLRRLVAEGTLTAVVQPEYQKERALHGDAAARTLFRGVFGFVVVGVVALSLLGVVFAEPIVYAFASGFADRPEKLALTAELTRWLFPVVVTMGLIGLFMAVLNAHDEYASPALSPIVLNVSMIVFTVLGAWYFDPPIFGIVVGVLVGGVLQVAVQLPALRRLGLLLPPTFTFADPRVRDVMRGFVPGLFGLAVYQVNIIVLRQIASYMAEGSVSYYYTADRLMELTNGVFAIAIAQGAFTAMNTRANAGDLEGLKRLWSFSFDLTNLIAIPAALGLAVLAEPIVSVLFLHGRFVWADVEQTALNVMCASFGLVFSASVRGTIQVFLSLKDRKTPVVVSAVVVVVNLLVGLTVMQLGIGVHGLSATLSISNAVQAVILMVLVRRKIGALGMPELLKQALVKTVVAVVACAAAWGIARFGVWSLGFTLWNACVLAAAIGVAVALYGLGAVVLKISGADDVAKKVARKLKIKI